MSISSHGPTVASYVGAFWPSQVWTDLSAWPPDVFALTNLVLDHTDAYRLAVSPPPGSRWPPVPNWGSLVTTAAEEWTTAAVHARQPLPEAVNRFWRVLMGHADTPLAALRAGKEPALAEALLTLHAMADEACRGLAWPPATSTEGRFEQAAWSLLAERGSLSHIDPTRVRITPKTHSAARGITIRSLSRYLALIYESIDVRWRRMEPLRPIGLRRRNFNLLLVPWPLEIEAGAFRPTGGPLANMDPSAFGFFSFDPGTPLDLGRLRRLVEEARRRVGRVDSVIFPEAAVDEREVPAIEGVLADLGVLSLFAGVRTKETASGLGGNYVHLSVRTHDGWESYQQPKHHRWCLDRPQIRQYHLSHVLDPSRQWWEAIDLPPRTLEIVDVGGGGVVAPLVCEDLARMDEVADVLRRIGPSLVVAVLLDGPQLPQRWPCRYAGVLADEPGSAVLTLSSLGMVARSRPAGRTRSRVVAMWNDPISGPHQIELGRGASGVLITASVEARTVWTADGRRHEQTTPSVSLSGIQQLRASRSPVGEVSRVS